MRNVLVDTRLRFALALVTSVAFTPRDASVVAEPQPLAGDAINELISGSTVHLHTPLGSVVPVVYGEDGTLSGEGGMVSFFLGASKDKGRWWISKSKLCQKWNVWFKGKTNCLDIRRRGAGFHWSDGKGESGIATIAVRGNGGKKLARINSPVGLGGPLPSSKKKAKRSVAKASAAPATPAPAKPVKVARAHTAPTAAPIPSAKPTKRLATARTTTSSQPEAKATRYATSAPHAETFRVVYVAADDVLNIRRSPSAEAGIVAHIPHNGRGVRVTGPCNGEWCPILHANRSGWVHRAYIASEGSRPSAGRFHVVNVEFGDVLNIRHAPSPDAAFAGSIPPNAGGIRLMGSCSGEWCPIKYQRQRGWVNRAFIAPAGYSTAHAP